MPRKSTLQTGRRAGKKRLGPPIVFRTWDEAMDYFEKHLTPVEYGPKGQPIFSSKDMEKLNVRLPVDY